MVASDLHQRTSCCAGWPIGNGAAASDLALRRGSLILVIASARRHSNRDPIGAHAQNAPPPIHDAAPDGCCRGKRPTNELRYAYLPNGRHNGHSKKARLRHYSKPELTMVLLERFWSRLTGLSGLLPQDCFATMDVAPIWTPPARLLRNNGRGAQLRLQPYLRPLWREP